MRRLNLDNPALVGILCIILVIVILVGINISGRGHAQSKTAKPFLALRSIGQSDGGSSNSVMLAWNPNPEPDIAGYRVWWGTVSQQYTNTTDAGNVTTANVPNLSPSVIYYFALTAYDIDTFQSGYSNEIAFTLPTPIPTPSSITISGTISWCTGPAVNVAVVLAGPPSSSTITDISGNYAFGGLPPGANYTVTPTRPNLIPGSFGINASDTIAVRQHYLGPLLPACFQPAADVNGDGTINMVDVVAIQRFFLAYPFGTANVGKSRFTPTARSYQNLNSNQMNQNFQAIIYGDVVAPFVP